MKYLRNILISGLIGIGIGMIWLLVELLFSMNSNNLHSVTISGTELAFWIVAAFVIGVFFYLAGLIFQKDNWSLRKQFVINFFICFVAWTFFELMINNFSLSFGLFFGIIVSFVIMYASAYGGYFFKLNRDISKINQKLKQVK